MGRVRERILRLLRLWRGFLGSLQQMAIVIGIFVYGVAVPTIDAEYCLAEGGGVTRVGGKVKYASVQALEKIPRAIELTLQARNLRCLIRRQCRADPSAWPALERLGLALDAQHAQEAAAQS